HSLCAPSPTKDDGTTQPTPAAIQPAWPDECKDGVPSSSDGKSIPGQMIFEVRFATSRFDVADQVGRQVPLASAKSVTSAAKCFGVAEGKSPHYTIHVLGYADRAGADETNRILSQQRADAVRAALAQLLQIAPEEIASTGKGEEWWQEKNC